MLKFLPLPVAVLLFASPGAAQSIVEGEQDYWRKPDIDYSVFEEDKPVGDKGLFEVDKKRESRPKPPRTFKRRLRSINKLGR